MKYGLLLLPLLLVVALTAKANAQKPESDPLKRAIAELQAGNTDKAIAALNEVISKHPGRADAYLLRGNLKMSTGDSYGALRDINKVIQLKPDLGSAYHERAVILLYITGRVHALRWRYSCAQKPWPQFEAESS